MKNYRRIALVILIAALLPAAVVLAATAGWGDEGSAGARINLSNSGDIRQPALTIGAGDEIAVAWAGVGDAAVPGALKGIFLAVGSGQPLTTTPPLTLTGATDAWAPALAYDDDQLLAAWVQGTYGISGTLWQEDVGSGNPAQAVMAPVYGYTAPRLAVGANGMHMIFSASRAAALAESDIYYTYRAPDTATWLSPTKIITHAQASAPDFGEVWYPHMALGSGGTTIHIIWEQTIRYSRSVWYASGTWLSGEQRFDWGDPIRLSSAGQKAVRPKVAVDGQNRVHVSWVEQVYQSGAPKALQYIRYRRFEGGEWIPALDEEARRLDPSPVQVNTYRPTWSTISIATGEDILCIAWHGYRAPLGETGEEEVFMNCSRNGGETWSGLIINVSETPDDLSLFPTVGMDSTGKIHAAWEEHQGGADYTTNYDVVYRNGAVPETKIFVYLPLMMKRE